MKTPNTPRPEPTLTATEWLLAHVRVVPVAR